MLIQFNFSNYKSYKNQTSLDMTATSQKEHQENLILHKNFSLLKVAAIYGANASGKSNVIESLQFMRDLVIDSFRDENDKRNISLKRFHFDNESKIGSSSFDIFFISKETEYHYGFVLNENEILEEWLYKKKKQFVRIFDRNKQEFKLSKDLKKYNKIIDSVKEKTLLLSFLSNLQIEEILNAFSWFKDISIFDFGNILFEYFLSRSLQYLDFEKEEEKENFKKYLNAFDLGIQGIRIEKTDSENDSDKYKGYTQHINQYTKEIQEISLSEESSGTKKMIALYTQIQNSLKNGKLILIDELDAKLHPLLTRFLINLFQQEDTNRNNAQLIFSTHDINTLSKDIFRRDQIWFTEKNIMGESELYSLAEYKLQDDSKIRKDATYNKDYLGGRYGAIPNLKEFKEVGNNGD